MINIVSAIQFCPKFSRCHADVMENFRRTEPLIRQAASFGTSFLVFPELCLTGYSFLSYEEAIEVAELPDGPTFRKMRGVAVALSSFVSYGYLEIDTETGSLYNSASMIAPDGKVVSHYRKINGWGNDYLWYTPGADPARIAPTEFGDASVVVCRDLRDKIPTNIPGSNRSEESDLFRNKTVDIVAACVNWGKGGFPSTTWMDFVGDNKCTLVVANRWGIERNGGFEQDFGHGGSAIIDKHWKVHTDGLQFNADCVVSASLT